MWKADSLMSRTNIVDPYRCRKSKMRGKGKPRFKNEDGEYESMSDIEFSRLLSQRMVEHGIPLYEPKSVIEAQTRAGIAKSKRKKRDPVSDHMDDKNLYDTCIAGDVHISYYEIWKLV